MSILLPCFPTRMPSYATYPCDDDLHAHLLVYLPGYTLAYPSVYLPVNPHMFPLAHPRYRLPVRLHATLPARLVVRPSPTMYTCVFIYMPAYIPFCSYLSLYPTSRSYNY